MRRHHVLAIVLLMITAFAFWTYREGRAAEASEFAPATTKAVNLPAGTAIDAVIRNRIVSSSQAGDTVTAFVSTAVLFDGRVVIPADTPIKGTIEQLTVKGRNSSARIDFTEVDLEPKSAAMDTGPVMVRIPVQSDAENVTSALEALMGAAFGAAIGAASGDVNTINRSLLEAIRVSSPPELTVPIQVILLNDMNV